MTPPAPAERARRFLILPFRNVTRQADQDWLVEGSTTMLSDALGRWQGITVVPDEKLYPALKRAGISPGAVVDPPSVRRVAEETGGWTAVTGEVLATGGRVRVSARAWDVPTNRQLVRASSEIPSGGDVVKSPTWPPRPRWRTRASLEKKPKTEPSVAFPPDRVTAFTRPPTNAP